MQVAAKFKEYLSSSPRASGGFCYRVLSKV